MPSKKIILTVTNDLTYDQRMMRICTSLAASGYNILLVGRKLTSSLPLSKKTFEQKRLYCWFSNGKLFYIEYNLRLFFFLLFEKADAVCAIDLDTIVPCYIISALKKIIRIYDAHELFCEMKEVVQRLRVYTFWKWIERNTVPKFKFGYTVNAPIAAEFERMYGVCYEVIMNVPFPKTIAATLNKEKYFLYQGAVNEGRCFETLIPAMQYVNAPLWICGDGNFMQQAKALVKEYDLEKKVIFKGMVLPEDLPAITANAYAGITLFDDLGKSNYFSLANRFFDYIQAGIPQLCVSYPVYEAINQQYKVALLTKTTTSTEIADNLNNLLNNTVVYHQLKQNCAEAAKFYNWQNEEKKLIAFYKKVFE